MMKKAFLTFVAGALMVTGVQAQETDLSTAGSRKATAGAIATELNLNVLGGNGSNLSLNNSLNQLKVRYFMSDDMAVRLGFNLGFDSETSNPDSDTEINRNTFNFSINPGIEKHFAGTERLSPYVGAELSLGFKGASAEINNDGDITEYGGIWDDGTNRGYTRIGLNALAGFDYYLARNFFVGYEFGFGLAYTKQRETETTIDGRTTKADGPSNFNLGPNLQNGIRVGFIF